MDKLVIGCFAIVFAVFIGLLVGLPTMLLWNWLCPPLFQLPPITFFQAVGLVWLTHCLFPK